jgi:signal transduction histidine kinase
LPTRECTVGGQPGAWRAADGRLCFATVKGLVSVNPAQLKPNPHPPPVLIESILVDGQAQQTNLLQVGGPARLVLPHGKEQLEIRYTALNFSAPDRVRFKYRLEGYETTWVQAGANRSARYSRLPPGHYRFQVLACNQDGVWNETGSRLTLVVEPPFWQTWWFLCGAGAGFLAAVGGLVYYFSTQKLRRQLERARREEAVEKERSRIARDIHDQLGASLTQVTFLSELALSDKDEPAEIEAHARQLSQTARNLTRALDEITWAVNPANDTLEGLMTYVCKYAQEYLSVAGLACRFDVPAQLPAWPLSPDARHHLFLAVKEAITNIVRHAKATEARVSLLVEPSRFVLEIQDNGCGLPPAAEVAAKARHGLDNLRQRLTELGGQCEVSSEPGQGAKVRLVVPR